MERDDNDNESVESVDLIMETKLQGEGDFGVTMLEAADSTQMLAVSQYTFLAEVKALAKLFFPVVIAYLIQMSLALTTIAVSGHISAEALGATALGFMFCNVTGFAVGYGLCTAVDTLSSQAFGAKDFEAIGTTLIRSLIILWFLHLPIIVLWCCSEYVLLLCFQEPAVAKQASIFIFMAIPCLYPLLVFETVKKTLNSMGIVFPVVICVLMAVVLNIVLSLLLVFVGGQYFPEYQYEAAAFSYSFSNMMLPFFLISYASFVGHLQRILPPLRPVTPFFQDWLTWLKLGLPGCFMVVSEWAAFEIWALAAGTISTVALAAQSVLLNMLAFCFMLPLGMSVACSVRVGNHLGAGAPTFARRVSYLGLVVSSSLVALNSLQMYFFAPFYSNFFTTDEAVLVEIQKILPFFVVFMNFDALQGVCGGIFRGSGRQLLGASLNIVGYWLVAMPIGVTGVFVLHWGLAGIWIGLLLGLMVATPIYLLLVVLSPWKKLSEQAQKRSVDTEDEPEL